MKETTNKVSSEKAAYGDYTPSAQKQAHIDELIRRAIGKGVAVEGCIGMRNSYSEKGGQPYQRYYLSNGHTCFVSGFVSGEIHVSVSDTPAAKSSYTVKKFLAAKERRNKRDAAKLVGKEAK